MALQLFHTIFQTSPFFLSLFFFGHGLVLIRRTSLEAAHVTCLDENSVCFVLFLSFAKALEDVAVLFIHPGMTLMLGNSTCATISSMHSRFISYKHNDTILHQNWYFYNMKILLPPNHLLIPVAWLSQDLDSSPVVRALFWRVAYLGSDLIARARCGCQPVVRDLVWLLHLQLNGLYCALCALLSSLWAPAVLEALTDVPMSFLIMFYRIQTNQMFFAKILLLQQPCYHGFSQTQ